VDPPRAEAGLRDREAVAVPADQVLRRDSDVGEGVLGVPAVVAVVVAEHLHPAQYGHSGIYW
jgi:hypothetical protein